MPSPARTLKKNEPRIRRSFKRISPKKGFSIGGMNKRVNHRKQHVASVKSIHQSPRTLNKGRLSAACAWEHLRLEMILQADFFPKLYADDFAYSVTVADVRWQTSQEPPSIDIVDRVFRKYRSAIGKLVKAGFSPVGVCTFELSIGQSLNGEITWEPHFHAIVRNVPKDKLIEAFKCRATKQERMILKPLKVKKITRTNRKALSYICKIKATMRTEQVSASGRKYRQKSTMPMPYVRQWVRFMEHLNILNILKATGFPPKLVASLRNAEMATVVERFIANVKRGPRT